MINFDNLEIRLSEETKYSFVGIQKKQGTLFFYVPKGLKKYWELYNSYESKKKLFFLLYKTLRKFTSICEERGYFSKNKIDNRDGVVKLEDGSGENLATNEPTTLYNKLSFIDSLLDLYNELKILSLVYRLGSTERIKCDRIYSNLHRANFLDNGAIYLGTMNLPRLEVHFEQTDIIYLYCYLLTEVKYQLEEQVSNEIESLAERYRDKYLHSDSNLFNRDTYQITLELVIDSFENIDSKTVYKDDDYWDFYEAIEKFLYSDFDKYENGEIWGINNFCNVWESACLSYLLNNVNNTRFLFIDDTYLTLEQLSIYKHKNKILGEKENGIFRINEKKLKPDAVFSNLPNEVNIPTTKTNTYKLCKDNFCWNDYGFETRLYLNSNYGKRINIGFKNQTTKYNTFQVIKLYLESFRFDNQRNESNLLSDNNNRVEVNFMPSPFFSYWSIEKNQDIDIDEFLMMRDLRHVYYIALFEQSIFCKNSFKNEFTYIDEPVLHNSLFRDTDIAFDYKYFLLLIIKYLPNRITSLFREVFPINIIDLKYLSSEYIHNPRNIDEIKARSVRKQFVYEYLLKEYLEHKQIEQPKISSCFWIPEYNSGKEVVVSGDEYLDGYINLALVDPIKLLQHYVRS